MLFCSHLAIFFASFDSMGEILRQPFCFAFGKFFDPLPLGTASDDEQFGHANLNFIVMNSADS